MNPALLGLIIPTALAVGGGIKWFFDHRIAARREPVDEMALTAQASKAIAEASAALIVPLQQQLAFNSQDRARMEKRIEDKIASMDAVLRALQVTESECQATLIEYRDRIESLERKGDHA